MIYFYIFTNLPAPFVLRVPCSACSYKAMLQTPGEKWRQFTRNIETLKGKIMCRMYKCGISFWSKLDDHRALKRGIPLQCWLYHGGSLPWRPYSVRVYIKMFISLKQGYIRTRLHAFILCRIVFFYFKINWTDPEGNKFYRAEFSEEHQVPGWILPFYYLVTDSTLLN